VTTEDISNTTKASAKETGGDMLEIRIGRLRSHESSRRRE